MRRGVRRRQGHRDQEVGRGEAQQHQDQDLARPPGTDALEHGQRPLTVGALRCHPPVDRQRSEQGDQDQHDGGQGRQDPRGQERDGRLVADGREVIHAGQAADLPPPVAWLVLADLPVRTRMTPLTRWMPRAVQCPSRHRGTVPAPGPGGALPPSRKTARPRRDNSKKRGGLVADAGGADARLQQS